MEQERKYSLEELQGLSYRYLQQVAKSLSLPCTVKKVHLIEFIHAKTCKTEAEVAEIIERVKMERQQLGVSTMKKKMKEVKVQGMEVTSTSCSHSPPLDFTPKRTTKYDTDLPYPQPNISRSSNRQKSNSSDRVLRSYNAKCYKRPNYNLMNNCVYEIINTVERPKMQDKAAQINIMGQKKIPKGDMARCVVRKYRPNILGGTSYLKRSMALMDNPYPSPTLALAPTRHNIMYSNDTPEISQTNQEYIQRIHSVDLRHTDGKVSKINALVQKQGKSNQSVETNNYRNVEVTIQDIINSNIEAQTLTSTNTISLAHSNMNMINYPNMSGVQENDRMFPENVDEDAGSFAMYYHKKIRSDQVRNRRYIPALPSAPPLPRFDFNLKSGQDFTRPLFVNCGVDSERTASPLEVVYNYRRETLPLTPAPPAVTTYVYSAPVFTTAVQRQPSQQELIENNAYAAPPNPPYPVYINNGTYETAPQGEQDMTLRRYYEVMNASNSSFETSTDTATIPEMVQDALEIISQDGDYMERIGMDVRMRCLLCAWAGPKFMLVHHVRNDHSSAIKVLDNPYTIITYKLSTLINQQQWLSQVWERDATLFALSVKYEDPDCFMAGLATLTSEVEPMIGTLTIYHKVSGEPYKWTGPVPEIATNMPYENTNDCLKIKLSKLELLPNSANVRLHNRMLVADSPSKAIIGQAELNDIQITIWVNLQNTLPF